MEDMNLIETSTDNRQNEKGVTTVEYAVMIVLVAAAVILFGTSLSNAIKAVFTNMASSL